MNNLQKAIIQAEREIKNCRKQGFILTGYLIRQNIKFVADHPEFEKEFCNMYLKSLTSNVSMI